MKIRFTYPFDISSTPIEADLNDFLSIPVNCKGEEEANSFLRSMWNVMNRTLSPDNSPERVLWAYFPHKYTGKQCIVSVFGFAQTSIGEFLIAISYRKKGDIDNLLILYPYGKYEMKKSVKDKFRAIVKQAVEEQNSLTDYICSARIKLSIPDFGFATYKAQRFVIESTDKGEIKITFRLSAIDHFEADQIAIDSLKNVCAFLSVETNINYEIADYDVTPGQVLPDVSISHHCFAPDFIDYYPSDGKWNIIISSEAYNFINDILLIRKRFEPYNDVTKAFLSACKHCKAGLVRDEETQTKQLLALPTVTYALREKGSMVQQEVVSSMVVSFLSSIECLTVGDSPAEICEKCGAPKYKIARRVKDLSIKYLGDEVGRVMYEFYGFRSKFVHTGKVLTDENRLYTVPLVNSLTGTGVMDYGGISVSLKGEGVMVSITNIKEWTTYVLRCFYKERFMGKTVFDVVDTAPADEFPIQIHAVRPDTVDDIRKIIRVKGNLSWRKRIYYIFNMLWGAIKRSVKRLLNH